MRPLLRLFAFAASCLAIQSQAFEHTIEYRFSGAELTSFEVIEAMNESPALLTLELMADEMVPMTVEIESDMGFGDCPDLLAAAKGNANNTLTIVADVTAQTLNGVALLQCSLR